jgi:hypothetical protein
VTGTPLGPGGRPFRGWRFLPLLLSFGALGLNAVILLSDRAPGLFRRLSVRIDAGVKQAAGAAGVDVPGSSVGVPRSDFDVHVLIWAVAALLVGLAAWSWVSLFMASATVYASSVVLELAQDAYSRSRTVQFSDLVGNAVGVLIGTALVATFSVAWMIGARLLSRGSARSVSY